MAFIIGLRPVGIGEGHQLTMDQIPIAFRAGHSIFRQFDDVLCSGISQRIGGAGGQYQKETGLSVSGLDESADVKIQRTEKLMSEEIEANRPSGELITIAVYEQRLGRNPT